jgi:photosystem II stability/assembly factor-like uncharacterized protein
VANTKYVDNVKYVKFAHLKTRIFIIGLITLLSLNTSVIPAHQVRASSDAVKWSKVNIPTEGEAGNWVLADGSDIQHLTAASDGTLYAYGKGLTYTLYQSTDGGASWSHIGDVQDNIAGIAISPHDASTIYYATSSAICRSIDGGRTFYSLPSPGGAGTNNIEITSIDVAWLNNDFVAIGTRDTDNSEFGGVYTLDEANMFSVWTDTNLGNYDVYAVAFSPDYTSNPQLVAVMTDETDTFTASKIGDSGWSAFIGDARLNKDNSGPHTSVAVANSAAIAFSSDYDAEAASGNNVYFIAIDTGTGDGDVYKISCARAPYSSIAIDLNIGSDYGLSNLDVTGLAACGDTPGVALLAGTADSAQTYLSTDGGSSWTKSRKEPTGESRTYVLMAPDFNDTGIAFTATSGHSSALSISRDNGETWNQLSLIDTAISTIVGLAPSPHYIQDNTLFMLTFGSGHSLWRSQNGGHSWERILASALADVDSLTMVGLPPQYSDDIQTVFVTGESHSRPTIWESTDNGQDYWHRFTRDPATNDAFTIDTWVIVNETTLFIGSYDGSNGRVYNTANSGFFYSEGTRAGSQPLNSLALSPDYQQDETILAGNSHGWVYRSDDNGKSFQPLPANATSPPLTGSITVAFDPEFDSNHTVYAASDTDDSGIYRFIIGSSDDWESIDSTLPGGATINRLIVSDGGVLYAANSDTGGGMERCLNPIFSLGPTFETVTRSLTDGATLCGLWQADPRLWSIDTTNVRLMTFNDTMTTPVTLISPDNQASGIGNLIDHTIRNISLDWETLDGATSYRWQCDHDTDFSSVPDELEDTTQASSTRLPFLEPATTYYCRVRATAPVLSPWSEKWSFTTSLDTETIPLRLESPAAGASDVPVKPLFQWKAVTGADAYELLVSSKADFSRPVIIKNGDDALTTNAWQCDINLDYDTTYYWKIRAMNTSTFSTWSASGAFTTQTHPIEETTGQVAELTVLNPTQPPETPAAPQTNPAEPLPATLSPTPLSESAPLPQDDPQSPDNTQSTSIPNWVLYLIGALLLTIMLALVTILTMVLKSRRF